MSEYGIWNDWLGLGSSYFFYRTDMIDISKVNVQKFQPLFLFLFSYKMLVIRAGIHKMLVRIANREELLLQKQSDLGLHCFCTPFWLEILERLLYD